MLKNTAGLDRREEVNPTRYREEILPFWQRVERTFDSHTSLAKAAAFLAGVALLTSPLPFVPELILVVWIVLLLVYMRLATRRWSAPLRVPAFVSTWTKRTFRDATIGGSKPGNGMFYLGSEFPDRRGIRREVWAEANDLKTHRLVIGTTGSGKTEEMLGLFHNALTLDSGTILVDGKADPKTFEQMLRIARLMGREEDFYTLNYLMAGRNAFGASETRASNTYNPLASGAPAAKAELMISLLDSAGGGSGSDMWQGRAISFLEAIMQPLTFLAERGYVLFSPKLLCDFYLLENIENFVHFGIFVDASGEIVNLKRHPNPVKRRDWDLLRERYLQPLLLYLDNLPGYAAATPAQPHPVRQFTVEDMRRAETEYWKSAQTELEQIERLRRALQAGNRTPSELEEIRQEILHLEETAEERFSEKINASLVTQKLNELNAPKEQKAPGGGARDKVLEQHGYITMQLVRATGNLTFSYGHIYNVEVGEINFRDIALNRRILYVTLPALERSKQSMEQLGKMAVTGIKALMGEMLNVPFEGVVRETIDARASNAEIPLPVILDEYGYYVVEGFAVAPAQARSYGFSMTFGVQDYSSLIKANQAEGEATFENTNLRHIGRTTGGEKSPTWEKLSGAAGNAYFFNVGSMDYRRGNIDGSFVRNESVQLQSALRLNYNDLAGQRDGEFTLIIGTKDQGSGIRSGSVRVVRYLAYYTGAIKKLSTMRLNHFVMVPPVPSTKRDEISRRLEHQSAELEYLRKWGRVDASEFRERLRINLRRLEAVIAERHKDKAGFSEEQRWYIQNNVFLRFSTNIAERDPSQLTPEARGPIVSRLAKMAADLHESARIEHRIASEKRQIITWMQERGFPADYIRNAGVLLEELGEVRATKEKGEWRNRRRAAELDGQARRLLSSVE
ncbi:TraG/TraD/VirD4 family protein [Microvirga puerhi]|uniref:Uncharacterized protein n=1 Tax=Microvirga puerhi TaxID=2876078 RepID=A0ABS7VUX6_9HYPH|nr:TraG/TraD/VirD4 family protein [Microvirga puerhi]MBZ6078946.1 hypothetical protein [Microvirga puerhi]